MIYYNRSYNLSNNVRPINNNNNNITRAGVKVNRNTNGSIQRQMSGRISDMTSAAQLLDLSSNKNLSTNVDKDDENVMNLSISRLTNSKFKKSISSIRRSSVSSRSSSFQEDTKIERKSSNK